LSHRSWASLSADLDIPPAFRDLGGREGRHLPQDERYPLPVWQVPQAADDREPDALARGDAVIMKTTLCRSIGERGAAAHTRIPVDTALSGARRVTAIRSGMP
jgi:hypothetical protein